MEPIPEKVDLAWILKNKDRIRDALRTVQQSKNLDYILPGGDIRRATYSQKSRNAVLDLRTISSAVSELAAPSVTVLSNTWSDLAVANGGCVTQTAVRITSAVHAAIEASTFSQKIVMLYPFCGCNIISALVPLIDRKGVGLAINTGFIDADFSQSVGLSGTASKYLDTLLAPNQIGANEAQGGLGWWELNIAAGVAGTYPEPIGAYLYSTIPDHRFTIDLRATTRSFNWGLIGTGAGEGSITPENGHYYGQSSSSTLRQLFLNGALRNTNTTPTATTSDRSILLMGANVGLVGPKGWAGRGFAAYLTDGTMTQEEVAAFHALLTTYLINPKLTGVPVDFEGSDALGNETFPDPNAPGNVVETDCEACLNSVLTSRTGEPLVSRETGNLIQSRTT